MDERSKAMEAKLSQDSELRFKTMARRNRKLGVWAAEKLGKSGDDAAAYAAEVVKSDFEEAGDDDVLRKVSADFRAGGVDVDDAALREKMEELKIDAAEELSS